MKFLYMYIFFLWRLCFAEQGWILFRGNLITLGEYLYFSPPLYGSSSAFPSSFPYSLCIYLVCIFLPLLWHIEFTFFFLFFTGCWLFPSRFQSLSLSVCHSVLPSLCLLLTADGCVVKYILCVWKSINLTCIPVSPYLLGRKGERKGG